MKRSTLLVCALALIASLAFAAPHPAHADPSARRMAETKIANIRVWVTVYKSGFANLRTIAASGWMSAGNPFYIHFGMANNDEYKIRGQVHADANATGTIADTTASFHNRTGVAIFLRKNANGYYWEY